MQRQSLGSPSRGAILSKDTNDTVSKPEYDDDDPKRRNSSPSLFITDDECKTDKPLRRCHYQPEKYIHLIPLLLVVCFFILYISSHDPSSNELARFHGIKQPERKTIDGTDIDEIERISNELKGNIKNNGVFSIRSLRNLQEEVQEEDEDDKQTMYRSHRKLGDF